ncbi:transient receptor potential cation channel subfamily M member 5-like [Dreissena polymorpha]|uniref:transient receptor potential cation channel subfamily M member 5-like n=1 Tax=Dreissena polymorpha TaxID=45954 RepID=UPI0022643C22|nr:transient receptor potential cation channel subfamily M member 5-like [Dreissena polymorpha]
MGRSRTQDVTNESVQQVNVVNLVLNGDNHTLETVTRAMDYGTPSVVVKGSKGVAEFISYEVNNTTDSQKRQDEDREYSKNGIITDRTIRDETLHTFQKTYHEKPYLLWVWDLRNMPDIPDKWILDICWKAKMIKERLAPMRLREHDLALVSKWWLAYSDCSRNDVLQTDDLVCYFCIRDCIEPIKILYHYLGMMDSVYVGALQYKKMCNEADTDGLLKGLRPKLKDPPANKDLARIMEVIQIMKARPVQSKIHDEAVSEHWKPQPDVSCNPTQKNRVLCFGEKSIKSQNRSLPYGNYLFLWACMMRKHELAEILFRRVENPIAMALITYNLFKAVERQTDDKVLKTEMQKYMKKSSAMATGILNECALRNDTHTNQILTIVIPVWQKTCIELAIESKHMEFLDQLAVRNLLGTVCNGKLEDTTMLKFCSCIMCPALSLKLLNYKTDKSTTQDNPVELTAQKKFCPNLGKIKDFLLAPKTKFAYNLISYVMFLSLFAYVLLFDLASTISNMEYVLMTWVLALLGEEIRQMATSKEKKKYFLDGWNIIDICTIAMFLIGFGMRFKHFQDALDWPRVVLAVDFVAFFLRLIHIFSVQNVLGPKLIMIQQMFQDMVYFLVILVVFLLSYAIASHSILFPDSPVTWETFRQIIRKPYWHLYGELFLEDTEGFADCTTDVSLWTNGTFPRCPSKTGQLVVPIMMGMYMLFTNILLLNLLIAMFSHTFTVIHKRSESLWCYQRYFILKEYGMRPVICPPLNICWHIYDLVQRVCCRHATVEDPFRFDYDKKCSNSASTDAVKSIIIEIDRDTLRDNFPDLQRRAQSSVYVSIYCD